jgi:hypothetical protein
VGDWVVDMTPAAYLLGLAVVFFGGMVYKPLAVAVAEAMIVANVLFLLGCAVGFVAVQFRRDEDCPGRAGRDD